MSRQLFLWEKMFHRMNKELNGHNNLVTVLKINGCLDKELLVTVVKALFDKHPHLRARIIDDNNSSSLDFNANFMDIPISHIEKDEMLWDNIYNNAFNGMLEFDKYNWRVVHFKPINKEYSYIISTYSHALIDGISAYSIAKDFIHFANQIQQKELQAVSALPATFINTDNIADQNIPSLHNASSAEFKWPYQTLKQGENTQTRTSNIWMTVSTDILSNIKPRLKEKKLSINDFLNGVLIRVISTNKPNSLDNIILHTPINLRTFVEPNISNENVLCATRLINTYHNINNSLDAIANAEDYQRQLIHKIKHSDQSQSDEINNEEILNNYISKCKSERDSFFMGFCISNLGIIDFNTSADMPYTVESFNFSSSRQASDCVMFINANTYNKKIHFNFNFTEPMLNRVWVQAFADKFLKEIASF